MYEYKDKDIVSLSVNFRDLVPSSEDITQDELRLVTSDANKADLSTEELNGLKKRFKKINYTILDIEQNRRGFGVTEDGMKTFVDHFNATKKDKDLHNFFKDHDYGKIDSMLGRIVDTEYDQKNKRVRRTALIDLRHPTSERLDMFQNLSTTLLHGKPVCSVNGEEWTSCSHSDAFPMSTVAYGIEDSLVTQSAYPSAKRDSLGMFQTSLSNIDIAEDYFKGLISDKDKLSAESVIDEKEAEAAAEAEKQKKLDEEKAELQAAELAETKEKQNEELGKIKKDLEFIKEVVEKDI